MSQIKEPKTGVQVVARVADVLHALDSEPDGLSLAQIAERVGLARSTVHRLVVALADEGFVSAASPNARVRLGPTLARLGAASRRDMRDEMEPFLKLLGDEFEETVGLAILDGKNCLTIKEIQSPHPLRAVVLEGDTYPVYSVASGQAFLAEMDRRDAEKLLPSRMPALAPNTFTTRSALWEKLEIIRETGYSVVKEEQFAGICAISTLVYDGHGPAAALSVMAPSTRFDDIADRLAKRLLEVAAEATQALGGTPAAAPKSAA